MNLKLIASVALVLGFGSVAFAGPVTSYFPPERIHCGLNDTGRMRCEGINHQYLVEDSYTADLSKRDGTFNFTSGVAYFTTDLREATVYYTYKNSEHKVVKLKTTSILIHPDMNNSGWYKIQDDLYLCDAGYMQCPITDLPGSH